MMLGGSQPLWGGQNFELRGHTTGMMPELGFWAAPCVTATGHTLSPAAGASLLPLKVGCSSPTST